MKKMLSMVLVLMVLLLGVQLNVAGADLAKSGKCGDNVEWEVKNYVLTISGTGEMSDRKMNSGAFWGLNTVNQIIIKPGITYIGEYSLNCPSAESISIPSTVKEIGEGAFYKCANLIDINLPSGLKRIERNCFSHCSKLEYIVIPNGVETIGEFAFCGCESLPEISIPSSVEEIEKCAFWECKGLENVNFSNGIKIIGSDAFCDCEGLTSISMPDSVEELGDGVFSDCLMLEKVELSSKIVEIPGNAFYGCKNLKEVTIPTSVEKICSSAFANINNRPITINYDGTTEREWGSINIESGNDALRAAKILYKKVSGGTSDGEYTVSAGAIEKYNDEEGSVKIPEKISGQTVTAIKKDAFNHNFELNYLVVPDTVKTIEQGAFSYCPLLKEITIPFIGEERGEDDTISHGGNFGLIFDTDQTAGRELIQQYGDKEYGSYVVGGTYAIPHTLEKVVVTDDTYITYGAFSNCKRLKNVEIGKSVKEIDEDIFLNCTNLEEVSVPFIGSSRKSMGSKDGVFGYLFGNSSNGDYVTVRQYYSSEDNVVYKMPASLKTVYITDATQIPYGAFDGCIGIDYIKLNEGVTTISQNAFANCEFLSVWLPDSVERIGADAFKGTDVETLYVYENSYAHEYAEKNGYSYEIIGKSSNSVKEKEIAVSDIELNYTDVDLEVGETKQLKATIYPEDATNTKVTWSTSDSKVVTVNSGKITAVGEGEAFITVKSKEGNISAKCYVQVESKEIVTVETLGFSDVPSYASYAKAVEEMAQKGIITGYPDGTFRPNNNLTRAEAATLIVRMLDEENYITRGDTIFTDIDSAHWAAGYVNYTVEYGIINGMGDGTFDPSGQLTYGQIVKMIVCAVGEKDLAEANGGWDGGGYLYAASKLGITEGIYGSMNSVVSRATVAQLIYNALSENEKESEKENFGEAPVLIIDVYDELTESDIVTITGKVTDETGSNELTCDGEEVVVERTGKFSVKVELEEGSNSFKFVAKNKYGSTSKMVEITLEEEGEAPTLKIDDYDSVTESDIVTITGKVTDETGSNELTCDGEEVVLKSTGKFSIKVELEEGSNSFKFVAKNKYGTTSKTVKIKLEKEEAYEELKVKEEEEIPTYATEKACYMSPKNAKNSVIDVSGGNWSKESGTDIVLWSYGDGEYASRQFKFVYVEDGWYKIVNLNTSYVLDANCATYQVTTYGYHGGDNQLWKFEDAGSGYYYIRMKMKLDNKSYYLSVDKSDTRDGTKIIVAPLTKGNNQKFSIRIASRTIYSE